MPVVLALVFVFNGYGEEMCSQSRFGMTPTT